MKMDVTLRFTKLDRRSVALYRHMRKGRGMTREEASLGLARLIVRMPHRGRIEIV